MDLPSYQFLDDFKPRIFFYWHVPPAMAGVVTEIAKRQFKIASERLFNPFDGLETWHDADFSEIEDGNPFVV